ncbi:MAG: type III pantothenate kinase [Alphaproteobacteria bacterium]
MLLAIDCGNTNTVFAMCDRREIRAVWRASTDAQRTADEYAVWLTQLMALDGLEAGQVDAAIIANVVPPVRFSLESLVEQYFRVHPLLIGDPNVDLGIEVHMDMPREHVGADRLVNAVGARMIHGGDLIVIDFGTATSFDIVDADGNYSGGILAPGINLSVEALYMAASQLPRVAIERPPRVIGKATIPAMQSGIFWGYVAMIEGLTARIAGEYGKKMKVVATGGLASLFADATDVFDAVEPDLTIRGLIEIHRLNGGG